MKPLNAFREVEDALVQYATEQPRLESLRQALQRTRPRSTAAVLGIPIQGFNSGIIPAPRRRSSAP